MTVKEINMFGKQLVGQLKIHNDIINNGQAGAYSGKEVQYGINLLTGMLKECGIGVDIIYIQVKNSHFPVWLATRLLLYSPSNTYEYNMLDT